MEGEVSPNTALVHDVPQRGRDDHPADADFNRPRIDTTPIVESSPGRMETPYHDKSPEEYILSTPSRAGDIDSGVMLATNNSDAKTLKEWLHDDPALLKQARDMHENIPEWQGINPDKTPVYYRNQDEVNKIRRLTGEKGRHHPHGLALGGPEGQTLTQTGETRAYKNPLHTEATAFQRKLIRKIREQE
jgi:hypothetical protein